MLVVLQGDAAPESVRTVRAAAEKLGFRTHLIEQRGYRAIAIPGLKDETLAAQLSTLAGVAEVRRLTASYKLASRQACPLTTEIPFPGSPHILGGAQLMVLAGPAALSSREHALALASALASAGATFFHGGALRPRVPGALAGEDLLQVLAEIQAQHGLLSVVEVSDLATLELGATRASLLQLGPSSMQNFSLLKAAGGQPRPILLQRGISATLEEFLMAAEYILSEGNPHVVLCERGIRTFADHSASTLDLSLLPAVQRLSHLPILVDPSRATGQRASVAPMARAAVAAGVDGLLLEVDSAATQQALDPQGFADLLRDLARFAPLLHREIRV